MDASERQVRALERIAAAAEHLCMIFDQVHRNPVKFKPEHSPAKYYPLTGDD
jgi:hypothetical protein